MKLLVTGASGLVGSSCVNLFTKEGWDVIGIDNNTRAHNLGTPEKHTAFNIDFTKLDEIYKLFSEHTFDAIIHAGGQASHDWSNDHVIEDFLTNAMGTVILLEATRTFCPTATFVYVSSDKVYGENMETPVMEEATRYTPVSPVKEMGFTEFMELDNAGHRSPFGVSKTSADLYVQEYAHTFGLKTGVFRPGCITGRNHEGAELHGFLAYLAKCIKEGKAYNIFGFKGKQVRDQIHADDLAQAFLHFIAKPKSGEVFNIGGGLDRSVSVLEAISYIEKEIGKKCIYELKDQRPGDRIWDVHNVTKFRTLYPQWDYEYNLSDIIKDVCQK